MSHFCVLVIGDEPVEEQLDPFWELDLSNIEMMDDERASFQDETELVIAAWEDTEANHQDNYETIEEMASDYFGYIKVDEQYGYFSNNNAKWDWYEVGGRWHGHFRIKDGGTGELGKLSYMRDNNQDLTGFADRIKKGDIDFDWHFETRKQAAEELWDNVDNVLKHFPDTQTFDSCRKMFEDDIDMARELYHNQSGIKAINKEKSITEKFSFFGDGAIDIWKKGRNKYIQECVDNVLTPYAILLNGKWYQRGEMGWWGMGNNEKEIHDWCDEVNKLLTELPDGTLITAVDCHI